MWSTWKTLVLAGTLALVIVPAHAAAIRFRPGFSVGWGYRPYYRSYWGPYWAGPYWGSYWGGPAYTVPSHQHSGQLKFDTKDKNAQVYIDGAYAGTVKSMNGAWLREGNYSVEVRSDNGQTYDENVYIAAGKTLSIRPGER